MSSPPIYILAGGENAYMNRRTQVKFRRTLPILANAIAEVQSRRVDPDLGSTRPSRERAMAGFHPHPSPPDRAPRRPLRRRARSRGDRGCCHLTVGPRGPALRVYTPAQMGYRPEVTTRRSSGHRPGCGTTGRDRLAERHCNPLMSRAFHREFSRKRLESDYTVAKPAGGLRGR